MLGSPIRLKERMTPALPSESQSINDPNSVPCLSPPSSPSLYPAPGVKLMIEIGFSGFCIYKQLTPSTPFVFLCGSVWLLESPTIWLAQRLQKVERPTLSLLVIDVGAKNFAASGIRIQNVVGVQGRTVYAL